MLVLFIFMLILCTNIQDVLWKLYLGITLILIPLTLHRPQALSRGRHRGRLQRCPWSDRGSCPCTTSFFRVGFREMVYNAGIRCNTSMKHAHMNRITRTQPNTHSNSCMHTLTPEKVYFLKGLLHTGSCSNANCFQLQAADPILGAAAAAAARPGSLHRITAAHWVHLEV